MPRYILVFVLLLSANPVLHSQAVVPQSDSIANESNSQPIPSTMKFSANVQTLDGEFLSGTRGLTFAFFKDQTGGAALWIETQSVTLDSRGRFTVELGATRSQGIPADIFGSGEPRWIGITPEDGVERPRIQFGSVPYAFKSAEADTLGGKRPDEFVSVQQLDSILSDALRKVPMQTPPVLYMSSGSSSGTAGPPASSPFAVPMQNLNADLLHGFTDSAFAKLGEINLFSRTQSFPGGVRLPANSFEAYSSQVFDSASLDFESAVSGPQNGRRATQLFRWISQASIGVADGPSARLALLFGANGATPNQTGFSINSDGTINFAPGQQLPGPAVVAALSAAPNGAVAAGVQDVPTVETRLYVWNQTPPPGQAIQAGTNEVKLAPCPRGVNGTDLWHYVYIHGTGTPEVVLITGGSCKSGALSGSLQFTASYAHPSGYTIGTATDGVQEAAIAAVMPNGQPSRQVMVDPGTHLFRARFSIRASSITVMASGASVICAMNDTCVMMGDPSDANAFNKIVLHGLVIAAGIPGGTWPAVEDNANGSRIENLSTVNPSDFSDTFGSLIQIDNDQAAVVDGLDTHLGSWGRCDASFCPTAIVGPGPYSKNAGILWIQNSNISLGCSANGIDNENGNAVNISNSVVQAYPQFGIRARTVFTSATVDLHGVHEEIGNCVNPLGTGMAGIIVGGGKATVSASGSPDGRLPVYANQGTIRYFYHIVVHSSTMGTSPAYMAGTAYTNGLGTITVVWNKVGTAGIISYDVLRVAGDGGTTSIAPYGTGPFAIATGIPATSCSDKVCSVVDNVASVPALYTVSSQTFYWPSLWMWPGVVILTTPNDYQNTGGGVPTQYFTDSLTSSSAAGFVASAGASQPSVFANQCDVQGIWSSIWMSCLAGNAVSNDNPAIGATVMQLSAYGGAPGGLKGRLNFTLPPASSVGATHVITIHDSDATKTFATPNNRPSWDDNDTYIGYDNPPGNLLPWLSIGNSHSISLYIGKAGNSLDPPQERLTASLKRFAVPVQMTQVQTGTSDNTDAAGTVIISSGTSAPYPFAGHYVSPPSCSLTPLGDPTPTGAYWASITATTLTANIKIAGSISFSYLCWAHKTQ